MLSSLIGDYRAATSYTDTDISWGVDTVDLGGLSIQDAIPFVINAASQHRRVVIISKNHVKPQHRLFTLDVINQLADIGFTHLGMETLSSFSDGTLVDSMLHDRGYPLDHPRTGTYTLEPQMGNIVRMALARGYKLFPYERTTRIGDKCREEIQADNIIAYINDKPEAKVITLCGFHHTVESDLMKNASSKYMANYLKDKSGLNPLTIYQDNFTEKFMSNEHPLLRRINITKPSLFTDRESSLVSLTPHVDIEIIHPRTIYLKGRPNWMFRMGQREAVDIDQRDIGSYPVIISTYIKGESNSVPVDRIELKHINDTKVLVLAPGSYRIQIDNGNEVTAVEKEVK